jgi:hypothetical protein
MEHVTGLFKRQLDTWERSKGFQTRIIGRIRERLEEQIAKERNTGVERTMGYSDNLEALRQEFGMGPEEADSQFIQNPAGGQEDIYGQAN